ncbi:unnamed protein product [Knipowitschia caucasica]
MEPRFRKKSTPSLSDSHEATRVKRENRPWCKPLSSQEVLDKAKKSISQCNGDPNNRKHLLGFFEIQFGIYRGPFAPGTTAPGPSAPGTTAPGTTTMPKLRTAPVSSLRSLLVGKAKEARSLSRDIKRLVGPSTVTPSLASARTRQPQRDLSSSLSDTAAASRVLSSESIPAEQDDAELMEAAARAEEQHISMHCSHLHKIYI